MELVRTWASVILLWFIPATPIGDEDFNTPQEIFAAFYLKMIEFQSMVYDAMEDAEEEQDHTTKVFLDGFMMTVMKYIDQASNFG